MHVTRVLAKLEPGGAQLAVLRLTRGLARRHGFTTTLLVGDATYDGLRLAERYGVETIAFRTGEKLHPFQNLQWQLSPSFGDWLDGRLIGADIVHAHMVGAWWAVGQVIGQHTPFLATEHNQVDWSPARTMTLRSAAARVDRFYAMGPSATRFAIEAGVRSEAIRPARSPVEGLGTAANRSLQSPRITFAGRLAADKGPDILVEALGMLDGCRPITYLLGDGPLRVPLLDRRDALGMAESVVLPGWVDRPWTYVAGSSVHVVPSREEAWSQSAVLALGLGVPVIGTDVDGLGATLGDGRGITVPADDPGTLARALRAVLDGKAEVDLAGAARYARTFSEARVTDFYRSQYEELLTGVVLSGGLPVANAH